MWNFGGKFNENFQKMHADISLLKQFYHLVY